MVGEGPLAEKLWLEYLKELFQQAEIETTVVSGAGNARKTMRYVLNEVGEEEGGYDRVLVLMDTDESWGDLNQATDRAKIESLRKNRVKLLGTDPCLEGFFLRLLDPDRAPPNHVVGIWPKSRHGALIGKIHHRFQDRIPEGRTRPVGSLCDGFKDKVAGRFGAALEADGVFAVHFPKATVERLAAEHPLLENIIRYLRNVPVGYDDTIVIG